MPGALTANLQYSRVKSFAQSPFEGGVFVEQKGTGVNFEYRALRDARLQQRTFLGGNALAVLADAQTGTRSSGQRRSA